MAETRIDVESVKVHSYRNHLGYLNPLVKSIRTEGLHRPIVVWTDGTLISGMRRLRAYFVLAEPTIPAVFVDTIEEAAKHMLGDNQDTTAAVNMTWSEICLLWRVLRALDGPAAVKRLNESRRRGVELRRLTQAGERPAGRRPSSEDYVLSIVCEPFGISVQTARRIESIWEVANGLHPSGHEEHRDEAAKIMQRVDGGEQSIWAGYQALMSLFPNAKRKRQATPEKAAATTAPKQIQHWEKALSVLEGVTAGIVELGSPHSDLTWDQVGPVYNRLAVVRRTIEQQLKQMKASNR